jgi:hypothetical protein
MRSIGNAIDLLTPFEVQVSQLSALSLEDDLRDVGNGLDC